MIDWKAIQHEWETTKITFKDLAEKHGVPEGTLKSRRSREKWKRDKDATKTKKDATIKKVATIKEPVILDGELTDKQRFFCIYYIKYFNATKAYRKAYECDYFTAKTNGSRLLSNANISKEIDRMRNEALSEKMLSVQDVIQKYIDIAFADITDFIDFTQVESESTETTVEFNPDGSKQSEVTETVPYMYTKFAMHHSDEIDGTLITEISKGKDGMFKLKLADQMKALEALERYVGFMSEEQKARVELMKSKVPNKDTTDMNQQINALADLINNPAPNRVIDDD